MARGGRRPIGEGLLSKRGGRELGGGRRCWGVDGRFGLVQAPDPNPLCAGSQRRGKWGFAVSTNGVDHNIRVTQASGMVSGQAGCTCAEAIVPPLSLDHLVDTWRTQGLGNKSELGQRSFEILDDLRSNHGWRRQVVGVFE